ncbi:site-specific DNA-methyltransferase [Epilithonimonas sp.]|uniref:site-specific DNA-methyltransferase n=1 Tax=Epilithonimonas sp. TaxID=2894511 RepID=UPI0028999A7C|nr:site-specific DNA-methyltransferase [Epilithonimonas sp.]
MLSVFDHRQKESIWELAHVSFTDTMKLYQILESQLKKEPNYVSDNGELKKWVVLNKAQNFDEELIGLLLDNSDLKQKFFIEIKSTLIFNQNLFIQFLEQKNYLNDSYTQFKNKVGLSIDGKYLKQRNEVALVWPFKDCVLEGGQSREEDKREEIFFNETLAQDEITELLDPKVLTNAKVFDKDGEKDFSQFKRNENGTITDNLIIKGNNLLALHSLKKEFAGKVKLIYIDPPYNTDKDSFRYNDSFNHSTWLTFMKNRLEVAKDLLSIDGGIYVQADWNEIHYLKILMDDVFGRDNFRNEIVWFYENKFKFQFTKNFNNDTEAILFYSKKNGSQFFKHVKVPVKNKRKQNQVTWDKEAKKMVTVKDENGNVVYYESDDKIVGTLWNIPRINSQSKERKDLLGQKPEELIERILLAGTEEGDLVLDFFIGTGTTCSVAQKMNRKYIGIEQLDYINTMTIPRLIDVFTGADQSGISKKVDWQGGGSFIYLELKKYNQTFIEKIEEAENSETLLQIWEEMKEKSFLNYNVDIKKQEQYLEDFKLLSLKEQKQHLCELLNKNQLYVNLSSLNDENFECTAEEKNLNRDFYKI